MENYTSQMDQNKKVFFIEYSFRNVLNSSKKEYMTWAFSRDQAERKAKDMESPEKIFINKIINITNREQHVAG